MPPISFEAPALGQLSELLPAYEFESLIAQGGMGAVYKARQRSLDRDVAIKILPRELGEDPLFRESFAAEAKAMARLSHANLIKVFDHGDADGLPYIVMEYVHGRSLFNSASGKRIEPGQAVEIVLKACRGLAHAHENGIVHRDIKPANILLNQDCEPKIGDFGLARPAGHQSGGLVMGTPGYTAPEVLSHPEEGDLRSDIFALGIILKEMLTGLSADAEGFHRTTCADARMAGICAKATAANPAARYSSVGEFCQALESWGQPRLATRLQVPTRRPAAAPRRPSIAPRRPSPVLSNAGRSTWKLWRNCAVIAFLLVSIHLTGSAYLKKQALVADQARAVLDVASKPVIGEIRGQIHPSADAMASTSRY